jgi:DNA-directed RNA polymerase II subunit RPB2
MNNWDILDRYFADHDYPFTNHHISSFSELIKTYIPRSINAGNAISMVKYEDDKSLIMKADVWIGGYEGNEIFIDKPFIYEDGVSVLLTPNEARLRSLTYQTNIYCNIIVDITDHEGKIIQKKFENIPIGAIPIMIHSSPCILHKEGDAVLRKLGECVNDVGGYFIIDGKEKVIVSQERISTNTLFTVETKEDDNMFSHKGVIRCIGEKGESSIYPKAIVFNLVKHPVSLYFKNGDDDDSGNHTSVTTDDGDDLMIKNKLKFGGKGLNQITNGENVLQPIHGDYKNIQTDGGGGGGGGGENTSYKYTYKQNSILLQLPNIEGYIPLNTLFRALGIESDREIYDLLISDDELSEVERLKFEDFLRPTFCNTDNVYTTLEAITYLKDRTRYKTVEYLQGILILDIFPNIEIFENKPKYLAYLVREFIKVPLGISPVSDRDGYIFKRVDISGVLLGQLFNESYEKLTKFIRNKMDQFYYYGVWKQTNNYDLFINNDNISRLIPHLFLTETFLKSLKGRWGLSDDDNPELGKVQDLSRISYIGFLSHLRRVGNSLDPSLKITSPHKLHGQQWGIMCPFETPDGGSIGYLKNLALLAKISSGVQSDEIKECLAYLSKYINVVLLQNCKNSYVLKKDICRILINNTLYATTSDPHNLVMAMRLFRRNGLFNILNSITWNVQSNEIKIFTEPSRPCRPVIILSTGRDNTQEPFDNKIKKNTNWLELICGSLSYFKDYELHLDDIYSRMGFIQPEEISELKDVFGTGDDKKDFENLLKKLNRTASKIEYLDIEEENQCYIAMFENDIDSFHTHLEIHPSTIMSVVSANIPMSNHSFAPRNLFHAAQSKQALGIYATNFNKRFDTMSYVFHYPQKPIVTTRNSQYTKSDEMPNGFNLIVAVMSYSGFNQEDSLMINRSAIDRGLGKISYYKSISLSAKVESPIERTIFINPTILVNKGIKVHGYKDSVDYSHLNDEGFISEGVHIPKGKSVAIIGMVIERDVFKDVKKGIFVEKVKVKEYVDKSHVSDIHLYGKIDKVYVTAKTKGDDSRICKVRFLNIRDPEFGDKHSSRHGQKGVIGRIFKEEDMPFTKEGLRPDIIMNSHAFPSRMTIAHIVECVYAKLCTMQGTIGDGTVFLPIDKDAIYDKLENEHQFQKHGNEILYNGQSGEMIDADIFIGPVFYFRLKHMVADKINSRSTGPKTFLTRQPTSGRRKHGGLRIGEMEKDAVLSHGFSLFTKESMMERSDKYSWSICKKCGIMASGECKVCNTEDNVNIETPYSFKLLNQELETMNIQMRFLTDTISTSYEKDNIAALKSIKKEKAGKEDVKAADKVADKAAVKETKEVKKGKEIKKKECPEGTVLNPQTGRCISKTGALAKKLKLGGGDDAVDLEENIIADADIPFDDFSEEDALALEKENTENAEMRGNEFPPVYGSTDDPPTIEEEPDISDDVENNGIYGTGEVKSEINFDEIDEMPENDVGGEDVGEGEGEGDGGGDGEGDGEIADKAVEQNEQKEDDIKVILLSCSKADK